MAGSRRLLHPSGCDSHALSQPALAIGSHPPRHEPLGHCHQRHCVHRRLVQRTSALPYCNPQTAPPSRRLWCNSPVRLEDLEALEAAVKHQGRVSALPAWAQVGPPTSPGGHRAAASSPALFTHVVLDALDDSPGPVSLVPSGLLALGSAAGTLVTPAPSGPGPLARVAPSSNPSPVARVGLPASRQMVIEVLDLNPETMTPAAVWDGLQVHLTMHRNLPTNVFHLGCDCVTCF